MSYLPMDKRLSTFDQEWILVRHRPSSLKQNVLQFEVGVDWL